MIRVTHIELADTPDYQAVPVQLILDGEGELVEAVNIDGHTFAVVQLVELVSYLTGAEQMANPPAGWV